MRHVMAFMAVAAAIGTAIAEDGPQLDRLLRNLPSLYERQVKTEDGRRFWHGARRSSVLDVSNGVMVVTYEDGAVFRDPQKRSAQQRVSDANGRIPRPVVTHGIPDELARARLRAAASKTNTVVVTTRITAGE